MNAIPAQSIPVFNKQYLFHSRYEKLKNVLNFDHKGESDSPLFIHAAK